MLNPTQAQGSPTMPQQTKPGEPPHQQAPAIAHAKNAAVGQQSAVNHVQQQAQSLGRSPTANGQYDSQSQQMLQKHLQALPDQQKQFVQHYLTPETLTLIGIVVGAEVYDLLKPMTNPRLQAIIVPRQQPQQQGGQPAQGQPQAPQQGASSQGGGAMLQPQQPMAAPPGAAAPNHGAPVQGPEAQQQQAPQQ